MMIKSDELDRMRPATETVSGDRNEASDPIEFESL